VTGDEAVHNELVAALDEILTDGDPHVWTRNVLDCC